MNKQPGRPIVFCIDSPAFGGAEKTAMRVLQWIDCPEVRVVHTEKLCAEVRDFLITYQIEAAEFPASGNRAFDAARGVWRAIRILNSYPRGLFVIWAHHSDSNRWLQFTLALTRRDFIVVERLVPARAGDLARSRLTIPLKRFIVARARAVVLNAHSQLQHYRSLFRIGEQNVVVVRNSRPIRAINGRVAELRQNKIRLRESLNIPNRPIIITVARLTLDKDHESVIRAMALLSSSVHLALIGDGPERAKLEVLAERYAPGRVSFFGYQSDPIPWLAAADIFVLASRVEGLPGALIEAMAAELPCIASNIPGNRDLVFHRSTGICVPCGSSQGIKDAIEELLNHPEIASVFARAGFEIVRKNHSEEGEANIWRGIFRGTYECLGQRGLTAAQSESSN